MDLPAVSQGIEILEKEWEREKHHLQSTKEIRAGTDDEKCKRNSFRHVALESWPTKSEQNLVVLTGGLYEPRTKPVCVFVNWDTPYITVWLGKDKRPTPRADSCRGVLWPSATIPSRGRSKQCGPNATYFYKYSSWCSFARECGSKMGTRCHQDGRDGQKAWVSLLPRLGFYPLDMFSELLKRNFSFCRVLSPVSITVPIIEELCFVLTFKVYCRSLRPSSDAELFMSRT